MLSNDLIQLLLICFFVYANPNSTISLYKTNHSTFQEVSSRQGQEPDVLHAGSYLIIGVFEQEKNARQLVNQALREGVEAHYRIHTENNFFYVYTYSDSSKTDVIQAYHKVRSNTSYKDAWILTIQPITEIPSGNPVGKYKGKEQTPPESVQNEKEFPLLSKSKITSDHKFVVFKTINQKTGEDINAEIQVIDSKRNKRIEPIAADQKQVFDIKTLALDTLQVRGRALGYRIFEEETMLYDLIHNPAASASTFRQDTLFVQLTLQELEAGDVQILYNTYFYGNSTVMRIQSKDELDEVHNILKIHPDMKIRLHGHTNGNSRGVSYLYLENAKNFFELIRTKEYQKKGVSSTTLSASRAETIKSYLINCGIAAERIETIGWGGKKMLYEPDSPMAKNNIRVEIEVLSK